MSRNKTPAARSTTIADVAEAAGVSIATVSRALTSPAVVSTKTRERVLHAVGTTGYKPNAAARTLRSRKSMMVMVVVPDIANSFFSEVLRGIDDTMSAAGYGIVIANLDRSTAKDAHYVGLAASGQVDGVILLCGRWLGEGATTLEALEVPTVAACEIIPRANIPQVDVANRAAANIATTHLVDLGHRRLAYVSGPARNILERERRAGFLAASGDAGISRDNVLICPGDFTFQGGDAAARSLLSLPIEQRPTAVFAANDEMAIGLIRTLRQHGQLVPRDLSVVGFDGIDYAEYCEPALTTMRQPRHEIGATAARLLTERISADATATPTQVRLPADILIRGSTGAPSKRIASR